MLDYSMCKEIAFRPENELWAYFFNLFLAFQLVIFFWSADSAKQEV